MSLHLLPRPDPDPATPAAERPGAALARFAERRGHPVLDALGAYWWRQHRFVYESLPQQRELDLAPEDVAALLSRERLVGLRYPTRRGAGEPNGLFVCRTPGFSREQLKKERRREVRRALQVATLRRLDPDELEARGLELNLQTLERQRRAAPELGEPRRWARFVRAVRDTPEAFTAGAFVGERLSAYVVVCRDGRWLHPQVKMARTADLALHTACALDVWLLEEAARDPAVEAFNSGLANHVPHLVPYKTSIGLQLVPLRCATQLHPALTRVVTHAWTGRAALGLASAFPRAKRLRVLLGASQTALALTAGAQSHA